RARRLALHAVGDDDGLAPACDRAQLDRRRKARAAATGQAALGDCVHVLAPAPGDARKRTVQVEVLAEAARRPAGEETGRHVPRGLRDHAAALLGSGAARGTAGVEVAAAAALGSRRLPGSIARIRPATAASTTARHEPATASSQSV